MFVRFLRHAFVICALFGSTASLHAALQERVKKPPATLPNSPTGAELYKKHCAVCHGNALKGVGPVPAPYRVPPDLTTLARRHDGVFPEAYVAGVLRNGVIMPAHGPAEMPIWGTDFRETDGLDATQVKIRIANLTSYIKLHQAK
jgi:mono/diheme cytochrome c family protein